MTRKGLIIFAREPLPGTVKTRLAATIGNEVSAELYQAMLLDVLEASRKLTDVETVIFWDCEDKSLPQLAECYRCRSRRQGDGELGQRMQTAFAEMFSDGFSRCCIIGSDAPDLPLAYLQQAFDLLESDSTDTVFGPSSDGGYYLLGLKRVIPQLFTGIAWSTPLVLDQSLTASQTAGVTTALLPEWHDIDTLQDLDEFLTRSDTLSAACSKTAQLATALRQGIIHHACTTTETAGRRRPQA